MELKNILTIFVTVSTLYSCCNCHGIKRIPESRNDEDPAMPSTLVSVDDYVAAAEKILDKNALIYFQSGADEQITLQDNILGFKRLIIRPRMLRNVSKRSTATKVLGKPVAFPLGVSPTAFQRLATPEGEIANSKSAAASNTIYILSTLSTTSIEDVAKATPGSRKWFQLYIYKNRTLAENLIQRAELAGFEALVLTVDTPVFGKRRQNIRHKFYLPSNLRLANFEGDSTTSELDTADGGSALDSLNKLLDPSLTWEDVTWLKSITKLPVMVKGILTAEDAELAVQYGVRGIFVSNHGARQLDSVSATIDALPAIVKQVAGRCDVYLDGGVRTGTDIFKAVALGAKMVFTGRPLLWGLAVNGEEGAKSVLKILKDEFDFAMALSGTSRVNEITENHVAKSFSTQCLKPPSSS